MARRRESRVLKFSAPMVRLPLPGEEKAVLMQDWQVEVDGWWLEIPKGTETDGASIPRLLWRICGHPLESPRVYAAVAHDWLYGGGGDETLTRKDADSIYRDLLVKFGFPSWRAAIEYRALRLFGGSHWTDSKETAG